jgi:ATP-dependent DNA helicase RecG
MPTITWDSKLSAVAGAAAAKIEKAFGYRTVGELLTHYPRRYVEKGTVSDLGHLRLDEHITFVARVARSQQKTYPDRRRGGMAYRLEVTVATEHDQLMLTFFDKKKHLADWRARTIREGSTALFSGKVGRFRDRWQLTNPQTQVFTQGDESAADLALAEFEAQPDLMTIYPATSAVQSWQLAQAIKLALEMLEQVPETLPEHVRRSRGLVDARQALEWIHRPNSWAEQQAAEQRLRFEEAFVTQAALAQRRVGLRAIDAQPRTGRYGGLLEQFDRRITFRLTEWQLQVSV